jgi:ATP-dependent DNA helicase RecQ
MDHLLSLLEKYWGYTAFRPFQQEIIESVISGREVFAMLPTGGGKSICYQVPALAQDGFCLVISPLIALMQDQVVHLRDREIAAACIHSGMSREQVDDVLYSAEKGAYKLLYVSPERLLSEGFWDYAAHFHLNLIAVDEAHCISQWGHDFRPAYLRIREIKKRFPETPVLALTATATEKVERDIIKQLDLVDPAVFRQSVSRENLSYHVRFTENKAEDIARLFQSQPGSGILYCRSRKKCTEAAVLLRQEGLDMSVYHAGLNKETRARAQDAWTKSHHQIMSATTAFGMGIDKPDVRVVAHLDVPFTLEEYYQEAGRAGRDGRKSFSVLFYNNTDISRLRESADIHYPPVDFIKQIYQFAGDFLQIPVGSGQEEVFPFDVMRFVRNFKLETQKTISAIKLLEREGVWVWDENTQTRSLVQFIADSTTLRYLEREQPELSHIATGLLRLHGEIFHYPVPLKLWDTSTLLRLTAEELLHGLRRLQALGIIDFQAALSGSTLYWLQSRVLPQQLYLDRQRIKVLRDAHEERIQHMIAFLGTENTCRNILLGHYFGERQTEDCGQCDVCRSKAKREPELKKTGRRILEILKANRQVTVQSLPSHFPDVEGDLIIGLLRKLGDEGICRINPNGTINIS